MYSGVSSTKIKALSIKLKINIKALPFLLALTKHGIFIAEYNIENSA
jgi:hypothetical protein